MRIIDVRGRGLTEQELTTIRAAGSEHDYVSYRTKPLRYLEIDYEIRASDKETLRKKIDEVSAIIETKENVPIIFPDEIDRIYYGEYAGVEESLEYYHIGIHRGTIYILRDKYKYSNVERVLTFPADIVTVENKGTAEADPIFELTAKKKATFAMISNGDNEYNLIGKPADVDEQLVDEKTLVLNERGETLDTWTTAGTSVDGGKVDGELGTDGTGILPLNYGTGDKWHGPALLKEINPIQDFEVEMRLRAETTKPDQNYRIEFYLFDENTEVLGKMSLWDNSAGRVQFVAEGRYGEYLGKHINYPISSKNYQRIEKHFHGMLRMRRIGQRFEFYVARLRGGETETGAHYDTLTQVFNDVNNEYQGRLKYVQIHIAQYATNPPARIPRINNIAVYEHKKVLEDQTPYILYPDDIVTFDHKNDDLLINGEPRNDLKNFGGSFFKLKKGENMIIVTPEDTFDTKVTFRDKYL